jgi:hypothetical protein
MKWNENGREKGKENVLINIFSGRRRSALHDGDGCWGGEGATYANFEDTETNLTLVGPGILRLSIFDFQIPLVGVLGVNDGEALIARIQKVV